MVAMVARVDGKVRMWRAVGGQGEGGWLARGGWW